VVLVRGGNDLKTDLEIDLELAWTADEDLEMGTQGSRNGET